jgi:outer membrane protein assembly factor BamB
MNIFYKMSIFLLVFTFQVFSQSETDETDLSGNEPLWRQALGGAVLSPPHVQAQSAVIAIDGGSIRAYSASGTPMWFYSAKGRINPFVTRSREGTSYLSRTNGALIAVNRSGRELWMRNIGGPLTSDVVVGWDGRLFAPTDKKISCYTASGNLLWIKIFESPFSIAPKLDRSGNIIFALENNHAYRVDPFGNSNPYMLSGAPAVLLSIEQQQILVIYKDGNMEIIASAVNWYFPAMSDVNSTVVNLPKLPAVPLAAASRGNNTAALLNDGRISFVSLNEGKIIWEGDTHIKEFSKNNRTETDAQLLFDERGIYVLSKNGASCFTVDGRRLWHIFLQDAAAIPAFGDDGILYSGGNDWILYAYKAEDRLLPARANIYGSAPEGSYGMGKPQTHYLTNTVYDENYVKNKLKQIESAIKDGRVGADEPAWTTFLLTASARNEYIQYRIKALQLLGQIGSGETIPWLTDIFRKESEPLIKAACASAIGNIGVDPDGIAIQTFLYSMLQTSVLKNEQVLAAITSSVGALCRFSGPPLTETGIRILNLLTENSYSTAIRSQASREIASLRQYNP